MSINVSSGLVRAGSLLLALMLAAPAQSAEIASTESAKAIDPTLAIRQFQVTPGFKVDLFASEPQLMNPVAFCFDEQGRIYVAETFRYRTSVYDIREHMNMFDDDLACKTVEDRAAMIKKYLGTNTISLAKESEVVRLIEDANGDGKADRSSVFADGFNTILDGIGSGILARKGNVYYADIPNLWLLQDPQHQNRATIRQSLSYGYGVHFNLTGHDLHGLCFGPDGKLYFSIGDRGLHVKTREGRILDYPNRGSVLRCDPDGANLEVFASGVRNPQELAFDDHGNLFSGDNNCDHGDSARLVYIVEGGDSGWRTGNQFSETTPAGVWNSEKLWYMQFPGQAAYILPPVGHIGNGPSGLVHYPGTGFSDRYRDHFFLCDFKGSPANSGIHTFAVEQNGATFTMVGRTNFIWNILATDVDFSPDGRMFISDWVQGWPQSQLGRLYRLYDPTTVNSPIVEETRKVIGSDWSKKSPDELIQLLGHADQRVRQFAQFELAERGTPSAPLLEAAAAAESSSQLARLHAIWALGQLNAHRKYALTGLVPLLMDKDSEVRAQTAKVLGDDREESARGPLIGCLADSEPRVQFFSAISLGKLKAPEAVPPLLAMLRANDNKDVYLRHAGMMGLIGCADSQALIHAAHDSSAGVRMGVLLAMRRLEMPEIAMFLQDSDPLLVLEAARAINDVPIKDAMPKLASLIVTPTPSEPLDWRVVNTAFRLGGADNASALAVYALKSRAPEKVREEALHALETWAKPLPRERLTGLWRPLPPRDSSEAAKALQPVIDRLLTTAPENVKLAAMKAVASLNVSAAGPGVFALAVSDDTEPEVRTEALKTLAEMRDSQLPAAVKSALSSRDQNVRAEALNLQSKLKPTDASGALARVLENGTVVEKQSAFATLGTMEGDTADQILADWLDKLIAGKVDKEVQLDLLQAADNRDSEIVKKKLDEYRNAQPKEDEFAGFREALYGGNAAAGRKIFTERPEAGCIRCHKINGEGGEAGPELTGIITRHDRNYILESILYPNKQIATGFENLLIRMKDGSIYAGMVKKEGGDELVLNANDDGEFKLVTLKKSDIVSRERGQSAMPEGMGVVLSKQDIRNLVEFLATLK